MAELSDDDIEHFFADVLYSSVEEDEDSQDGDLETVHDSGRNLVHEGQTAMSEISVKPRASFDVGLNAAITSAAVSGNVTGIENLIEQGANANAVDNDGGSALSWAAYYGNYSAVAALLRHGANVNLKDSDNETALSYAASKQYTEVMELLLKRQADPYVVNSEGWNVLNWAASKGHSAVVRVLLDFGVDTTLKDDQGLTAYDYASSNSHKNLAYLIYEHDVAHSVAKRAALTNPSCDLSATFTEYRLAGLTNGLKSATNGSFKDFGSQLQG